MVYIHIAMQHPYQYSWQEEPFKCLKEEANKFTVLQNWSTTLALQGCHIESATMKGTQFTRSHGVVFSSAYACAIRSTK